jgi:hypothetical protein
MYLKKSTPFSNGLIRTVLVGYRTETEPSTTNRGCRYTTVRGCVIKLPQFTTTAGRHPETRSADRAAQGFLCGILTPRNLSEESA